MFKKIYESIKNYIIENYRELILLVGFYIFLTYPLPYFILVSGGTTDVSDHVEIADSYGQKGSFNLAYVNELRGTIPTVLLSHIIPDWTLYSLDDYAIDDQENVSDVNMRDQLSLQESLQNATKVAYEAAKRDFNIQKTNYYIYYVVDFVKEYADIRVGDKLLSYDGIAIENIDDYRAYVSQKEVDDEIILKMERNGREREVKLRVYEEDSQKYTGISVFSLYDYTTDPAIKFHFGNSESGSSGGLTLALAIYNKLTQEDLTNGLKIVGTGTIEKDGTVGEIGGVEYKLKGAVKSKADVFVVPTGENYDDAKKLKEKNHYDIALIEATTFEETLSKLQNYTRSN